MKRKDNRIVIGKSKDRNKNVYIDIEELIKSRLLIQGNSGAGKSHTIRRLLEQTYGKIQHIVIDPEGEFSTLREKLDYVLIGEGGDFVADLKVAPLIPEKLLETGASAIIDLYEMKRTDRVRFVKLFFDALVNLPKRLWKPCLIVLDEAHTFAGETRCHNKWRVRKNDS